MEGAVLQRFCTSYFSGVLRSDLTPLISGRRDRGFVWILISVLHGDGDGVWLGDGALAVLTPRAGLQAFSIWTYPLFFSNEREGGIGEW